MAAGSQWRVHRFIHVQCCSSALGEVEIGASSWREIWGGAETQGPPVGAARSEAVILILYLQLAGCLHAPKGECCTQDRRGVVIEEKRQAGLAAR